MPGEGQLVPLCPPPTLTTDPDTQLSLQLARCISSPDVLTGGQLPHLQLPGT